jgi:hypothetical protein
LPGPQDDDEPKTIELLRTRGDDNPAFSAVKVTLPIGASVASKNSRLVVKGVADGSNADLSRLRQGDIIRAVSLPETSEPQKEASWWEKPFQMQLPEVEQGMVILDGWKSAKDYNTAIRENLRVQGGNAHVVLIIERPLKVTDEDDQPFFPRGGFPARNVDERLAPQLIPIPIPVDDNPMPPFPPRQPPNYLLSNPSPQALPNTWPVATGLPQSRTMPGTSREYSVNVGQAVDQLRTDHQLIPNVAPGLDLALPTVRMELAQVSGLSFVGYRKYAQFWRFLL